MGEGGFNRRQLNMTGEDRDPDLAVVQEGAAYKPAPMVLTRLPKAGLESLGLTERRLQEVPDALASSGLHEVDQPSADHSLERKREHLSRRRVGLHDATCAVEDKDGLRYEVDHRSPDELTAGLTQGDF